MTNNYVKRVCVSQETFAKCGISTLVHYFKHAFHLLEFFLKQVQDDFILRLA